MNRDRASADAYDPRRDDTASKIVVTREEIVKYGDTSVLDVLKRVPGVTVTGANGRGGEVRMRGLGSGYTQILINGERTPAGFTIDSLSPDVIERIEVLRTATAEFSTQSIAGTINIVLKKAILDSKIDSKGTDRGLPRPGNTPIRWSRTMRSRLAGTSATTTAATRACSAMPRDAHLGLAGQDDRPRDDGDEVLSQPHRHGAAGDQRHR